MTQATIQKRIHNCRCGKPAHLQDDRDIKGPCFVQCDNELCWTGPASDSIHGAIDKWNEVMPDRKATE